jgi:hypothetical protein
MKEDIIEPIMDKHSDIQHPSGIFCCHSLPSARVFHCLAFMQLIRCSDFLILECLFFIGCFISSNIMPCAHFKRFPILSHSKWHLFTKIVPLTTPNLDLLEGRPFKVSWTTNTQRKSYTCQQYFITQYCGNL